MRNSMRLSLIAPLAALLALAGCDSGDTSSTAQSESESAVPAAEQAAGMAEHATEAVAEVAAQAPAMMETAQQQVAAVAASVPMIDAGSLDRFKSSLNAMKGSLDMDGQQQLSSALAGLASKAVPTDAGGLLGAAKGAASGGSAEDTVYNAFGSKLNGLNFDQLMAFVQEMG